MLWPISSFLSWELDKITSTILKSLVLGWLLMSWASHVEQVMTESINCRWLNDSVNNSFDLYSGSVWELASACVCTYFSACGWWLKANIERSQRRLVVGKKIRKSKKANNLFASLKVLTIIFIRIIIPSNPNSSPWHWGSQIWLFE